MSNVWITLLSWDSAHKLEFGVAARFQKERPDEQAPAWRRRGRIARMGFRDVDVPADVRGRERHYRHRRRLRRARIFKYRRLDLGPQHVRAYSRTLTPYRY
jgi:hypothetical protein